jgi:tRNA pseudouridine38-40 synthase
VALRNIRMIIEYDGSGFSGWQRQPGRRTVEEELARALRQLIGSEPRLVASGRTDAGTHAEGQVANFWYEGRLGPARLAAALNARLPSDVVVLHADEAPPGFHARYSARRRHYRYRYLDRPARPVLDRNRCWHVRGRLDVLAMAAAASALVGRHDWTTFCPAPETGDRVRTVEAADVTRRGDLVELDLWAEGFLRGLARGIAGALAEVGRGRRPPGWVAAILEARDRRLGPPTAPAAGLTLVEVDYGTLPLEFGASRD